MLYLTQWRLHRGGEEESVVEAVIEGVSVAALEVDLEVVAVVEVCHVEP